MLEIEIKSDARPVKFQRGPKSYAYGPFVLALELCYDADSTHASIGERTHAAATAVDCGRRIGVDDGDLEDFLDSCDNDFNDEDDPINEGDNEDCESSDADNDVGDKDASSFRYNSMINDIRAIDVLMEILLKVKSGLVNNSLVTLMDRHGDVVDKADRYCSILIRSEIRTVDFFLSVGIECRHRLAEHVCELPFSKESTKAMENLLKIEAEVVNDIICTESMKEQVIGIANAFTAIRYSL